jgi:hypothetical protein
MRRTVLLFTTMALALVLAAGMAWAAPGPPTVESTVAPSGATGVDPSANIKAKFSEAMKERSINTNTFNLSPGHLTYDFINGCGAPGCFENPVDGTVRYKAGNRTAILDPTSSLLCNTEYTALIEGIGDEDHLAVKDRGGAPMASDYFFYFTTGLRSDGGPCLF